MAQSTDKTLKQLIINQMPRSVYNAKKAAGELDPEQVYLPDTAYDDSLGITAAAPGQIIKVKTVQDGKPTEWEAVDGGVQPDWNQNNETAADYVKNRPFYMGNPVETVLVEESTVTFDKNGGLYVAQLPPTFEATVGETYKVSWDGTTYECACVNFNNTLTIGNLAIVGQGSDTGEPFIIGIRDGKEIQIITADPSASHTVSVSGFVSEVVKIDAKYLPNTIATKSEVEAAQTTAENAQTTANAARNTADAAQTTANAAQTTADNAQSTANAALPKTGGTMSGNLTIDTENDYFRTIISPGNMALQYVPSAGDVNDELVISGWGTPRIVAREGSSEGFKLSDMGLSLGCTSTTKDGIHLRHSNGSSSPGEIVIQHTNLNNHAKERISIASTGEIECNNRLKFNCGSEIEVVQPLGKTGGSAIILHSSTPNSTKKFKINVDDSGVPTITDKSDSTNTWKAADLYEKPDTGIPKSDLADDVQTSLNKADTSISYDSQTLTDAQKQQARSNINAEEAGTSYTKSEVDTKLDEKINASNGKFKNSLSATTTNGTQIYQESIDFGSLREGYHVEIKKDGIRCINGSGSLGTQIFSNNRISYLNAPIDDRDAANKKYVDTAKTEALQLGLTAATPGQIIKVKTVQDGKPTEWEAVNMDAEKIPKFTKLLTHTITEDELAASPIAFVWGTAQIPNLNDFNVFVLTIVRPDGTKMEFSRWVRLKINNTLLGNICGTSTAASPQYTITANRLFGAWISGNYYDPRNIGVPVLVPPWSSSTFQSNLPDSEPVTSIGFTSYAVDYGLTAGIVVEIWGAK